MLRKHLALGRTLAAARPARRQAAGAQAHAAQAALRQASRRSRPSGEHWWKMQRTGARRALLQKPAFCTHRFAPPSHFSAWRQVPLGLDFLTFLAATVLVIPTFKSAKISPVLGFLFSGLLLGQLGCAPMAPARAAKQHTYPAGGASSVF